MVESGVREVVVELKWLEPEKDGDLSLPSYETAGSAGMDVCAAVETAIEVAPGSIVLVPTGFAVAIPEGYEIQVRPRSGLAVKHGLTIVNAPGTIDADYRGEVKIGLINLGSGSFRINRGDRIAQMILAPVVRADIRVVEKLDATDRGSGGFGHTGVR